MKFTLAQQLTTVQREIALRRSVYPKQVSARKMRKSEADFQVAAMEAVAATIETLTALSEDELADLWTLLRERRAAK